MSDRRWPDIGEVAEQLADPMAMQIVTVPWPNRPPPPPRAADLVAAAWSRPFPPATPTGFTALDHALGGGLRGEAMYTLTGPPGRGKTGLSLQLARNVAKSAPVIYVIAEPSLTIRQWLARAAAQVLHEPWLRLFESGPDAIPRIHDALFGADVRPYKIKRDEKIIDVAQQVALAEGRAPILFLDYMQAAVRATNPDERRLATSALSDEIGTWVAAWRTAAVVVSSTGRLNYGSGNAVSGSQRAMTATDFEGSAKESGDVDYDTSVSMYLQATPAPGESFPAKLHISKNRFGPPASTIGLRFMGHLGLFREDRSVLLNSDQLHALQVINQGATSQEDVRAALGSGAPRARGLVTDLIRLGMISSHGTRGLNLTIQGREMLDEAPADEVQRATPTVIKPKKEPVQGELATVLQLFNESQKAQNEINKKILERLSPPSDKGGGDTGGQGDTP